MKRIVCWMMILALLLGCAGGLAETADGNELTVFLQIIGSDPAPVYEKITDAEKAYELQPGQLCGLVDDITTKAGVRWYQIVYMNKAGKGAVGHIRPEYTHRLTLAEFNALTQDTAKANEAMDLLRAVDAFLKADSGSGTGTAASAGTENAEAGAKGENSAGAATDPSLFKVFYAAAMTALDEVFNMDVSGAIGDVTAQAGEIAGKALDAGLDVLDSTLGGVKGLVTDLSRDAAEKIGDAVPELGKQLDGIRDTVVDELGKIGDKAKAGIGEIADQAEDGFEAIADAATETFGSIGETAKAEIDEAASGLSEELEKLLTEMNDKISGWQGAAEGSLETWLDDLNGLFEKDSENDPAQSISQTMEEKLEELRDNLAQTTVDVSSALQAVSDKIEDQGLIGFASQLLYSISANDTSALADFWNSITAGNGN